MKRLFAALATLFLMTGCVYTEGPQQADIDRILKTTNAIYMDIRLVVTDPEIMPMFTESELETLAELEQKYLDIVEILKQYPNDPTALERISWVAADILDVLEVVDFVPAARPYVAAIRISIKILRNHL
jgi:hypothetical protein